MYRLSRTLVPKEELFTDLSVGDKPPYPSCTLDLTADLPQYVKMECPEGFASPINLFVEGGPYKLHGSFNTHEPSVDDFEFRMDNSE